MHGGPTGWCPERFIATASPYPVAAFAARGYAVLRCNPRGSSGYGKAFRYANYQDWGGKDYQDLMTGVDHVIQMGVADPERLGVMGWSYGGVFNPLGHSANRSLSGRIPPSRADRPTKFLID